MPRLLSTKTLTEPQRQLILNTSVSLVEYNAIKTKVNQDAIPQEAFINTIVTSQNAARICIAEKLKLGKLFCVGSKTAQLLIDAGYNVVLITSYAKQLAEIIIKAYSSEIFHYLCSNQRLDVIPAAFSSAKIAYTEHHIYSTLFNSKVFSEAFDAVLFFSPSGVNSYFKVNKTEPKYVICIGKTTAKAAKKYSKNLIISNTTSVESCIAKAIKLLTKRF